MKPNKFKLQLSIKTFLFSCFSFFFRLLPGHLQLLQSGMRGGWSGENFHALKLFNEHENCGAREQKIVKIKKNNEKQAKLLQPPGEKKPKAEKGLNKKLRWRDK